VQKKKNILKELEKDKVINIKGNKHNRDNIIKLMHVDIVK
jgi:hypothetical protein